MSKSKRPRMWSREEVVVLVVEYFRTKNLSEEEKNSSLEMISDFLRRREHLLSGTLPESETFRNYAGIRMQTSRIRCLDPETKYDGMTGTKLQKEIVCEYLENPELLMAEASSIYERYK